MSSQVGGGRDGDAAFDERFFVINGRKWRRSDPRLTDPLRQLLVDELMRARRAVKGALRSEDEQALKAARRRVGDAKVALGERGHAWWLPPDADARAKRAQAFVLALTHPSGKSLVMPAEDIAGAIDDGDSSGALEVVRRSVKGLTASGVLKPEDASGSAQPVERPSVLLDDRTWQRVLDT